MKMVLRRLTFVVMLCLPGILSANAQTFRRLTVDDFEGRPQTRGAAIAFTLCYVDVHYHAVGEKGYYKLTFDVQVVMDKDHSWIDRARVRSTQMLSDVLDHEQGHYTIAYMEQQEVLRQMVRTRFDADYEHEVNEIFDRIDAKYKQLNHDYDEDTGHMVNRAQQDSWDKYFQRRLKYMPRNDEG